MHRTACIKVLEILAVDAKKQKRLKLYVYISVT